MDKKEDYDIEKECEKLNNLTHEQLVDVCLGLAIEKEAYKDIHKEEVESAYEVGYGKGYDEGYRYAMEGY